MLRRDLLRFLSAALVLWLFLPVTGCGGKTPLDEPGSPGSLNPPPTSGGSSSPPPEELPKPQALPGMVMVSLGNTEEAKPQSGLNEAAIVFEVPAEGGITRLLLGLTQKVDVVGPVRSARKAMVELALGYGAPFGHCGASNDAYALIRETGAATLDDIRTAGGCFWRDKKREQPDNLYTSTGNLVKFAQAKGYKLPKPPDFVCGKTGAGSTGDGDREVLRDAAYIEYDFSWLSRYPNVVSYVFEGGKYQRSQAGKEHLDAGGERVSPANLVFIEVKTRFIKDEYIELNLELSSSEGKALYFFGGKMKEGTWRKKSFRSPIEFLIDGEPAVFEEGQIWVHIVRDMTLVKYR